MVAPTGVPHMIDPVMPSTAQTTDSAAEHMVTRRKSSQILMADKAGNMTRADTSRDPTRFMARTMMTAMITAIIRLYT